MALPGYFALSALHVLLQRLPPQADALHSSILLLWHRRLLCQAVALYQAVLVHRVRQLLLQAHANHIPLLWAAGINLRSARVLPALVRGTNGQLPF